MTAKKKTQKKEDKVLSAKEKRKLAWEAKQKENGSEESIVREEFRRFFVKIKGKLKLGKEMEDVLWLHFKSQGFDKKDKFEEGIKHFGYNL